MSSEGCTYSVLNSSRVRIPNKIGKYMVLRTLGKGGFAVVVLAVDDKTKQKVAIKIVDRAQVTRKNTFSYLENELRLSARFEHPNIVKIFDIIYEEDVIMVIMEYLPNGDLTSVLSSGKTFSLDEQVHFCASLLSALQYLHAKGISHRDIKPENILFDADMNPKFIDFGLSKENASTMTTFCGTPFYMAPEIILYDSYDGKKADVWALGVTFHVMCTKSLPYSTKSETQIFRDIQHNKFNLQIEATGIIGDLIRKMLVFDPKQRATSADLYKSLDAPMNQLHNVTMIKPQKKLNTEMSLLPRISLFKNVSSPMLLRSRGISSLTKSNQTFKLGPPA